MTDEATSPELGVVSGAGLMSVDIGNDGEAFAIDLNKLGYDDFAMVVESSPVVLHVVYLGLRNILMDSHAGVKETDYTTDGLWRAAKSARAAKKLDALYSGDVRMVVASSGTRGDEVKKRATQIIERHVRADWKKVAKKFEPKELAEEVKKRYGKSTAVWRSLAESQLRTEEAEIAAIAAAAAESGEDLTAELTA